MSVLTELCILSLNVGAARIALRLHNASFVSILAHEGLSHCVHTFHTLGRQDCATAVE